MKYVISRFSKLISTAGPKTNTLKDSMDVLCSQDTELETTKEISGVQLVLFRCAVSLHDSQESESACHLVRNVQRIKLRDIQLE